MEHGQITNRDHRRLMGVLDETARQELMALLEQKLRKGLA
jgi:hypothetical protein